MSRVQSEQDGTGARSLAAAVAAKHYRQAITGMLGRCDELREFLVKEKMAGRMTNDEIKAKWIAASKIK